MSSDASASSRSTRAERLPERAPEKGELVRVRSRTWLVDDVKLSDVSGQSALVILSCADDDAQGQSLDVYWDYELDRQILKEEGWRDLASKGFDAPRQFAAFPYTLRRNWVMATDLNLSRSRLANDTGLGKPIDSLSHPARVIALQEDDRRLASSACRGLM
jgi:hypothetical protein